MNLKDQRIWIAVCIVIFAAALVWCAVILMEPHGDTVTVTQDGEVLYTLDLSKETDREIIVEYEGRMNTIEIKGGRIHMLSADCPDNVCVHTGWLRSDIPIVCLPNKLVIEYSENRLDAVAR